MADVILVRGIPEHTRSDTGPEMTTNIVRQWLASVGAKTLYIAPGVLSPGRGQPLLRCPGRPQAGRVVEMRSAPSRALGTGDNHGNSVRQTVHR